ncbi:hypothetical protein ABK040_004644 [Willaertia magna]
MIKLLLIFISVIVYLTFYAHSINVKEVNDFFEEIKPFNKLPRKKNIDTSCLLDSNVIRNGLNMNLDRWMTQLNENINNKTLKELVLPGTSHSFFYTFEELLELSPDSKTILEYLNTYQKKFPLLLYKALLLRFSKTQDCSFNQQFKNEIRYFEMKVCVDNMVNGYDRFYICNNFKGEKFINVLLNIKKTISESSDNEFIILDITESYNDEDYIKNDEEFDLKHSRDLDLIIDEIFNSLYLTNFTLDTKVNEILSLRAKILLKKHKNVKKDRTHKVFYEKRPLEILNYDYYIEKLLENLKKRDINKLHKIHASFKNKKRDILKILSYTEKNLQLRRSAKKFNKRIISFLNQTDAKPNIVILDYYNLKNPVLELILMNI